MQSPVIKFKKLDPAAVIPSKGSPHSAGLDLTFIGFKPNDLANGVRYLRTGLAVQPPPGYYFELYVRSSLHKIGLTLANNVGIIDEDYRGEIIVAVSRLPDMPALVLPAINTRVAQLVLKKNELRGMVVEEADELNDTARGEGGFGSTGQT